MTLEAPAEDGQVKFDVNIEQLRQLKIFLMAPLYGGQNFGAFTKSLMELSAMCASYNIPLKTHFLYNESLVQRARNYCADEFMRSDCEIGIFIDSDIEFQAKDVIIMAHLVANNPDYNVLAGVYPKKCIAWEKIKSAVDKGFADEDPNVLENFIGDYVFNPLGDGTIKLSEPAEVYETGTGFMMFTKDTLKRVQEKRPDRFYKPDHIRTANFDGSRDIYAFFHCDIDPETRRYLSEDYWFCHKVREAGMKVWIVPWIQLKHNGYYIFGGSLAALAAVGENVTADAKKVTKK